MAGRLCCSLRIHVLRELNCTAGEETFDRRLFLFCSGHAILMFINLFQRLRRFSAALQKFSRRCFPCFREGAPLGIHGS